MLVICVMTLTRRGLAAAIVFYVATVSGASAETQRTQGFPKETVAATDHNAFRTTGSMTVAREGHLAVRLSDGRVLVLGGLNAEAPDVIGALGAPAGIDSKTTEIYDPNSGTFRSTAPMSSIDRPHTAVLMHDGSVLVYGKKANWRAADQTTPEFGSEIYDPASEKFGPGPAMNEDRAFPSATVLGDGSVLFAGGSPDDPRYQMGVSATSSAELFDPKSRAFSKVGAMHEARSKMSATILENGTVLVAGGLNQDGFLASAEIYDPTTHQFRATGAMSVPRGGHLAIRLSNGKVLILGGATTGGGTVLATEVYDPQSGTFSKGGELHDPGIGSYGRHEVRNTGGILLSGDRVWMMNAATVGNLRRTHVTYLEIYDPKESKSIVIDKGFVPRQWASVTGLAGGQVLIAGGENPDNSSEVYSSAELFVP